jgi:hypothetical protein
MKSKMTFDEVATIVRAAIGSPQAQSITTGEQFVTGMKLVVEHCGWTWEEYVAARDKWVADFRKGLKNDRD